MKHCIVAIGGSAGSLEVILKIVEALPASTQAVFIIVVHRRADADSTLAELIAARTALAVKEVEDKDAIQPGTIYIAPSDYHLLLEDAQNFSLDSSEKVHFSRPSIDVTFESACAVFGPQTIGVLLSGANADGANGLKRLQEAGGVTIVQNPATAEVGFMPQQAIQLDAAGIIAEADELPGLINSYLER